MLPEEADSESVNTSTTEKESGNPEDSAKTVLEQRMKAVHFPMRLKKAKNSWLLPPSDSEEDKPMKLLFAEIRKRKKSWQHLEIMPSTRRKKRILSLLQCRWMRPEFYGWLTGMGKDVILMKPKKSVQAYRDYLKGILKEYK